MLKEVMTFLTRWWAKCNENLPIPLNLLSYLLRFPPCTLRRIPNLSALWSIRENAPVELQFFYPFLPTPKLFQPISCSTSPRTSLGQMLQEKCRSSCVILYS